MSRQVSSPEVPPRRSLRSRPTATVEGVLAAAHEEVAEVGYEELSVRSVAARAGVSPATAYTYFGSKQHLIAELFARRVGEQPSLEVAGGPAKRLIAAFRELAAFMSSEPELAAAATTALLGTDPDVERLRAYIGLRTMERIFQALGDDVDPDRRELVELTVNGAMLEAGMGLTTYGEMGERLERLAPYLVGEDT